MKSLVDFINESTSDDKRFIDKMLKKYKIDLDDDKSMDHLSEDGSFDDYNDEVQANDYLICYNTPAALKYFKKLDCDIIATGKKMIVVKGWPDQDDEEVNDYLVNPFE